MTAEIAVMNKNAVALAADSALTIGPDNRRKVFTSAEKIFALSKYEPVAAMVYGNANLMGIPWEAIIKLYRRELGKRRFPLIEDYAKDLLRFLHEHEKLFPEKVQEKHLHYRLIACFRAIVSEIQEAEHENGLTITQQERDDIVAAKIQEAHEFWEKAEFLKSVKPHEPAAVRSKFEADAIRIIGKEFSDYNLTEELRELLLKIVPLAALKCPTTVQFGVAAGLVIAGFGDEAFFPALRSFSVNGIFAGHLNFSPEEDADIGSDSEAQVIPFAQDDQVYSFTHGVDREYQREIDSATKALLSRLPEAVTDAADFLSDEQKQNLKKAFATTVDPAWSTFRDEMRKLRMEGFYWPILDLVATLPKSELAAIAESMVNLTSLRRKMSGGQETVAGPIDVAVISKADGLIWIKRKHYFDPALNHQFFANYYRERRTPNETSGTDRAQQEESAPSP